MKFVKDQYPKNPLKKSAFSGIVETLTQIKPSQKLGYFDQFEHLNYHRFWAFV